MAFDLTVSEYARHRGCDEKAVRKAVAEGRITAVERDGRRWIDREVADIQWAKNTRARADSVRKMSPAALAAATAAAPQAVAAAAARGESAQRALDLSSAPGQTTGANDPSGALGAGQGAQQPPDYATDRARRERADAERAELEVAQMARRLLSRDDAERGVFDCMRELRDQCMASAKSSARLVIGLTEIREIEMLLEDAYRQAFDATEAKLQRQLAEVPPQ